MTFYDYSEASMREKREDKSKQFKDFNFKLVVMSSILEKNPSFLKELEELREKYDNEDYVEYKKYDEDEEIDPTYCFIPEIAEFLENIHLTNEDLAKVTDLCFDGGEEIYFYMIKDWDGEDDIFDVVSVEGFEKLLNLKEVIYISMTTEDVLEPIKEKGIRIS